MLEEVKTLMARAWNIDAEAIPDDASLNQFKPWDSLGHITMLLALETEYGLALDEESVQSLRTLPLILARLESSRATSNRPS